MTNPDFVLLAKAMGVHGIRVSSASELPEKMKEFLEYDGNKPVLLECVVEPSEHVFPMVGVFPYKYLYCPLISICCLGSCRKGAARTDLASYFRGQKTFLMRSECAFFLSFCHDHIFSPLTLWWAVIGLLHSVAGIVFLLV
jgi:hypothetical protein